MEKLLLRGCLFPLFVLSLCFVACQGDDISEDTPVEGNDSTQSSSNAYSGPPALDIDKSKDYTAVFMMDDGGEFTVDLYEKFTPLTVNNFVFLSREGYYDGVTFHRVIEGFMAQGGDPTGGSPGGPGYNFENEFHPEALHDGPGILSMANKGMINGRGTNGSQFFITFKETRFLDGYELDGTQKDCQVPGTSCHSVFGRVVEGMDIVNAISVRDPNTATTPGDVIKTIKINER